MGGAGDSPAHRDCFHGFWGSGWTGYFVRDIKEIARETLALCLAGRPPREFPPELAQDDRGDALYRVVERGEEAVLPVLELRAVERLCS